MKILLSIFEPYENDCAKLRDACPGADIEYSAAYEPSEWDVEPHCDADVILTEQLPDDMARWKNLKLVQLVSAGTNHITPQHSIWSSDVKVATASGVHAVPMAQFGIGSLLQLTHNIPQLNEFGRTRMWPDREAFAGSLLREKTIGIVGYGSIGRECARLARGMGMRVLALKRDPDQKVESGFNAWPGTGDPEGKLPEEYFAQGQIGEMLPQCDAIIVTAPRTSETENLIGTDELRRMKPSSVIIILSRGGIVNEDALCQALHEGWIAGAAVDAFVTEPLPGDSPLFDTPNIILTPHMSGVYDTYWNMILKLLCENLSRLSNGEQLLNIADRTRGY